MITSYTVVPFVRGARGLRPGRPQYESDEARAVRTAERLRARCAGVMVLAQEADPGADIYGEPRIVWHAGALPVGLREQIGSAA